MNTMLLTGATGKIGKVITKHFLLKGMKIIAVARTQSSLEKLAEEISDPNLITYSIDLLDEDSIKNLAEWIESNKLCIDYLVNNARNRDFLRCDAKGNVSRKDFISEFTLDVVIAYELSNLLRRSVKKIVNISSQYGVVAMNPNLYDDINVYNAGVHYSVAKAAINHLTRELAVRFAPDVQVNCIAFGGVEGRVDEKFQERYGKLLPLKRMLSEDEVIGIIDFLISNASTGITGQVIVVDGGWTIW